MNTKKLRWDGPETAPAESRETMEGWPMRPCIREFPDYGIKRWEWNVHCPNCDSSHITRDSVGAGLGSGPGGRHRMGDNYRSRITCRDCGHSHTREERVHTVFGPTFPVGG